MTTEERRKVEVEVYMWRTTTCDERMQICDESGQDTSNTPPSCPDKGKGKKREEEGRKKVKEQGGVLMFRGVGQHQGLNDAWRTPEMAVVS